jgi:hypothetical protein
LTLLAIAAGVGLCACQRSTLPARTPVGEAAVAPTLAQATDAEWSHACGSLVDEVPVTESPARAPELAARASSNRHAPGRDPAPIDMSSIPSAVIVADDQCEPDDLSTVSVAEGTPPRYHPGGSTTIATLPRQALPWLALLVVAAGALVAWRIQRSRSSRRMPPRGPVVVSWMPTGPVASGSADVASGPSNWVGAMHSMQIASEPLNTTPPPVAIAHDPLSAATQRARAIEDSDHSGFHPATPPSCFIVAHPPCLPTPCSLPPIAATQEHESAGDPVPEPPQDEPISLDGVHWARTGQGWWRQALQGGDDAADALDNAMDAFTRALALEPGKADVLGAMLSQCHLARARLCHGTARLHHLDQATSYAEASAPGLHHAEAYYQRALAIAPTERAYWLDRARDCLDQLSAQVLPGEQHDRAGQLSVAVQMAYAELAGGRQGHTLFDAGMTSLIAALQANTGAGRDEWLTLMIDCLHRRLLHLNGAARTTFAQRAKSIVAPWLPQAVGPAPVLAWLRFLAIWAEGTRGPAAGDRYAEVANMLDQAADRSPELRAGANFVRACHLRLHAVAEVGGNRLPLLRDALRLLEDVQDPQIPRALIALEAAQLHLAAARDLEGDSAVVDLQRAVSLADAAANSERCFQDARTCALDAQLRLAKLATPSRAQYAELLHRAADLGELESSAITASTLLADVQLYCGQYAEAAETCRAGWDAGVPADGLLPIWRDALARWSQCIDADDVSALRDQQQRLRTATTLHS